MNALIQSCIIVSIVVTFTTSSLWTGEITGLTEFESGDPALASEVNANFSAVKTAVDDNATDIAGLSASKTEYYSLTLWGVPQSAYSKFQGDWGSNGLFQASGSTESIADFAIDLPQGALIEEIEAYVYDASGSTIQVSFFENALNSSFLGTALASLSSSGSSGNETLTETLATPHVVDKATYGYSVRITYGAAGDSTLALKGLRVKCTITP